MYNLGHCEHNKFKPSSSLTISQETFSLTDQRLNGDLATLALWLRLQSQNEDARLKSNRFESSCKEPVGWLIRWFLWINWAMFTQQN